ARPLRPMRSSPRLPRPPSDLGAEGPHGPGPRGQALRSSDRLPWLRGGPGWSWPDRDLDDRCALGRLAVADPVAQAPLDLPRGPLRGGHLRRAGPGGLRSAGPAEHACDPVGDRAAPPRGSDDPGLGPATRDDLEPPV